MDFQREDGSTQTPQITGLPDAQFEVPPQSQYFARTEESQIREEEDFVEGAFAQNSDSFDQGQEAEIANWQARDLLIGEKNQMWYVYFALIVAVLVAGAWLIGGVDSWSFIAVIVVSAAAILMTRSAKHSQIINYALSTRGVYIGNDFYPYENFKAFGILREKQTFSILLMPKKRFSPSVSIYFSQENGEKITDILGARLPMSEVKLDTIDRIIRKINL